MRIHIIGGCGSGKTFIARELSRTLHIPHHQLDNLVWNRTNDTRFPEEIRDGRLREIIAQPDWIIEGVHHKWVSAEMTGIYADKRHIVANNLEIKGILKQEIGKHSGDERLKSETEVIDMS